MIVIGGMVLGILIGATTAKKNGGKPLDMAQYAAGYGIALALTGLVITIAISRFMV